MARQGFVNYAWDWRHFALSSKGLTAYDSPFGSADHDHRGYGHDPACICAPLNLRKLLERALP